MDAIRDIENLSGVGAGMRFIILLATLCTMAGCPLLFATCAEHIDKGEVIDQHPNGIKCCQVMLWRDNTWVCRYCWRDCPVK